MSDRQQANLIHSAPTYKSADTKSSENETKLTHKDQEDWAARLHEAANEAGNCSDEVRGGGLQARLLALESDLLDLRDEVLLRYTYGENGPTTSHPRGSAGLR